MMETERLILRRWQAKDREPWARMTADPAVMEFFPSILTRDKSDEFIDRMEAAYLKDGFAFLAAEAKDDGRFLGFIGLLTTIFEAHFTPCVEIGWRLAKSEWGKGFAVEGARRCLEFGFEERGLKEIVSLTSKLNLKSIRVMQKLKMVTDPKENFLHPRIEVGHRLSEHVLYRIGKSSFLTTESK